VEEYDPHAEFHVVEELVAILRQAPEDNPYRQAAAQMVIQLDFQPKLKQLLRRGKNQVLGLLLNIYYD
jgi:hypothetical protein